MTRTQTQYQATDASAPKTRAGLVAALLAVAAGGFAAWFWLLPQLQTAQPAADAVPSLAAVAEAERGAAIGTLSGGNRDVSAARAHDPGACELPLASVTLAAEPGSKTATLRLVSGHYISMAYTVTETPMRVAIPYPAAPTAGSGTIGVMIGSGHARVSLSPAWHVGAEQPNASRVVTWPAASACGGGKK